MSDSGDGTAKPVLRLVRGNPTPEELGAVVALLAARSAGVRDEPAGAAPVPLWSVPRLRAPLAPGPGAWRASSYRL